MNKEPEIALLWERRTARPNATKQLNPYDNPYFAGSLGFHEPGREGKSPVNNDYLQFCVNILQTLIARSRMRFALLRRRNEA